MKKILIISLILLFLMIIAEGPYALASNNYKNGRLKSATEYQDFSEVVRYSSEIAKLTKLSMIIQDSYNILIKNNFHTKNIPIFKVVPIGPNYYLYGSISGTIARKEAAPYALSQGCDWVSISLSWNPKETIIVEIEDVTTGIVAESWLTSNGYLYHTRNLNPEHNYALIIYNPTNVSISYSGEVTMSVR